jgi:DNA polymerase I-like protein with 3'-5' exonuclease and polymerase domains
MPVHILTDNEESPQPATSTKALAKMGDVGKILIERADRIKALSFVDGYVELIQNRPTMHPSYRTPGTITGRLSSSGPNQQQQPKTVKMMSPFIARPGHILIDADFASLEPTVTTEFSQDPNMEVIYGNQASPYQDFYLFIASSIPGIRERVLAAGYNPINPTKEGTANTKKVCKSDRQVCKLVALAAAYGASANKVMQILEEQNIFMSMHEVESIHRGYWELFAQVKDFGRSLYFEWKRNGGYIVNGMGRPMAVPEKYNRDLLNRFIQSTGHDILVKYVNILCTEFHNRNIPYTPVVIDLHDSTCVEVAEGLEKPAIQVFHDSMDILNRQLGGRIKLKGTPVSGKNLAEVKEAE